MTNDFRAAVAISQMAQMKILRDSGILSDNDLNKLIADLDAQAAIVGLLDAGVAEELTKLTREMEACL